MLLDGVLYWYQHHSTGPPLERADGRDTSTDKASPYCSHWLGCGTIRLLDPRPFT